VESEWSTDGEQYEVRFAFDVKSAMAESTGQRKRKATTSKKTDERKRINGSSTLLVRVRRGRKRKATRN